MSKDASMQDKLAQELHRLLTVSGKKISFAESCTGGMLQKCITDISGSSNYFEGGFVVYSNRLKTKLLKVSQELLGTHGAVSSECAVAMAIGLKDTIDADLCISVTGIAGPSGGSAEKPVGSVWFGFYFDEKIESVYQHFTGNRAEVREQATLFALQTVRDYLKRG